VTKAAKKRLARASNLLRFDHCTVSRKDQDAILGANAAHMMGIPI